MGYSIYFNEGSGLRIDPPLLWKDEDELREILKARHDEPGAPDIWTNLQLEGGERLVPEFECRGNVVGWIRVLLKDFLIPRGRRLLGSLSWVGDDRGDYGKIICTGTTVLVYDGVVQVYWKRRKDG